ncbi:hypothetical protein [Paraburkholderia adhaesiva]|uniref:hypothetical protein n=1 Tax=Paraburkholderia adhaesiva TaxID=2883244 RepID=UPI001F18D845|nr:hypothetical protein [Paraburkholderia adhaesiva]
MNDVIESLSADRNVTETAGARLEQSRELADLQINYLMAQRFPRDAVRAMDRILLAFTRNTLAEHSQYQYARGGEDIRGPSIKAMQEIGTLWSNLDMGWRERSRGRDGSGVPFSEMEAWCIDFEARSRKRVAWIVPHWRDRSETRGGGYVLHDERDVYELYANMAQRRLRECIKAIVPSDVVERAMEQADATLKATADTSAAGMAKMVEAFAPLGVTKDMIEQRIQRRLDAITASQVVNLKRVYVSLREGMSTPSEWFEVPATDAGTTGPAGPEGSRTAAVKSRMKARKATRAAGRTRRPDETFDDVKAALQGAATMDALNEAADRIRHLPDAAQRNELADLYSVRAADLDEGGPQDGTPE